jgi:hypothetical protein
VADPDQIAAESASRVELLESQIAELKQELWIARDAAIGATAELGTARAKVVELEALVHQLRSQLAIQEAMVRSRSYKMATRLGAPARLARRILG